MRRSRLLTVGCLVALTTPLYGCLGSTAKTTATMETERVLAYMQCQECIEGEREAVIAMGDTAVTQLRQFLLNGPPADRVQLVRLQLQRIAPNASNSVIDHQLSSFDASYRLRAADALGAIGSPAAREGLCRARSQPGLRSEVRAAVRSRLASGSCP